MEFLYIFIYIICTFGLTELLVYYDGFLHIFKHIRSVLQLMHPHLGELVSCVVCCSSWVGIMLSLINYFFITTPFTPFNIILNGSNLWWLVVILDMAFTAGSAMLLNHLDEMMGEIASTYDDEDN